MDQSTAVLLATQKGHLSVVAHLISCGADVNITNMYGNRLRLCLTNLVNAGSLISNYIYFLYVSCLHAACSASRADMIDLLLAHGASPAYAKCRYGST